MNYTQFTQAQRQEMLAACGAQQMQDLLVQVPASIRMKRGALKLADGLDELSLRSRLAQLARKNRPVGQNAAGGEKVCFLGAGAYDHFIPAAVDHLAQKAEFLTAYTPYQAEASQGALQAFFEFQTMVCQLTGMELSNASLYEGSTAMAEAALLALNVTGRRDVLISRGVHPQYRAVLKTYLSDLPVNYREVELSEGATDAQSLAEQMTADTAAVIVQSPNFLGNIEPMEVLAKSTQAGGALCVQVFNPISLGLLKKPGEFGVDVAVAEGQPLGIPLAFGGPYLGLFTCQQKYMRKMPGRLVGQTVDAAGRRAFCLTLQTREQHIRREKATSNVCTNQGLLALRASVFLAMMGPAGMHQAAQLCVNKTAYLTAQLESAGVKLKYPHASRFNEVLVQLDRPVEQVLYRAHDAGILPGYAVGKDYPELADCLLVAVTEKRTREELDRLVEVLSTGAHGQTRVRVSDKVSVPC